MKKTLFAATALATLLALPFATAAQQSSAPQPLMTMSDTERQAFRAEVRAYLLENPEVLMEAIAVLEDRRNCDAAANDQTLLQVNGDEIFRDPNSWQGGNLDGDITVVEFMDYRCSYCRKAHDEVAELIASDGNIRFVVKEFPILGPVSDAASRFAISVLQLAGPDAYKSVHDTLMTMRAEPSEPAFRKIAGDLGLDVAAVLARMETPEVNAVIDANRALATRLEINGTPTFVIDGTFVRGYVPLDGMRQIVEGQRKG